MARRSLDSSSKKLIGKTYNKFIFSTKKDIVVLYCSERDKHLCFLPKLTFGFLSEWSKTYSKNLQLAYLDVVQNEVPGL